MARTKPLLTTKSLAAAVGISLDTLTRYRTRGLVAPAFRAGSFDLYEPSQVPEVVEVVARNRMEKAKYVTTDFMPCGAQGCAVVIAVPA